MSVLSKGVVLASVAASALCGCSTQITVKALDDVAANAAVDGLPFRSRERYQVKLYRFDGIGYQPVDTKEQTASLANVEKLYVLGMSGSAFSDGTVTVKVRSDNTLESVSVKSTSKGQEALSALGKGIKDVNDAEATRDKDRATKSKATEAEVVVGEDSRVAALEAKQAADLALVELSELSATATLAQRTAAEQKVMKLKLVANQKARRAGLQPPFAEAGG